MADFKFPHGMQQNMAGRLWRPVCETFATSYKRPFVLSVQTIGLIYDVYAEGPVRFMKHLQRSPSEQLIPSDCSVNFCEMFVVRGREF